MRLSFLGVYIMRCFDSYKEEFGVCVSEYAVFVIVHLGVGFSGLESYIIS